jgi:hypothetical protein
MGLGAWLARKGNVGGTARAVANGWKTIVQKNPRMSHEEIAETYIGIRYGATGEPQLAKTVLKNLKANRRKATPLNLAWAVFSVENADEGNTVLEHTVAWKEVMREEIEKLGVKAD